MSLLVLGCFGETAHKTDKEMMKSESNDPPRQVFNICLSRAASANDILLSTKDFLLFFLVLHKTFPFTYAPIFDYDCFKDSGHLSQRGFQSLFSALVSACYAS